MTNIRIIEDAEATGETAKVYDEWRALRGRKIVPGILKCFSACPDFLRKVIEFSDTVHFSPPDTAHEGDDCHIRLRGEPLSVFEWTRTLTSCGFRKPKKPLFRALRAGTLPARPGLV